MNKYILSVSFFKTNSIEGNLVKTYVIVYNTGVVYIVRRLLTNNEHKGYITMKKFKNVFLIQEEISFKINSLNTIVEIVNNVKPYFNENDIIL